MLDVARKAFPTFSRYELANGNWLLVHMSPMLSVLGILSHACLYFFSLKHIAHHPLFHLFFFFFLFNFLLLQPSSFSSHYIFIKYIYFTKKLMLFSSGFLNSPLLQNCRIYLRDEGFVYSYQINLIFHFLLEVYNIVNDYLRCLHLLLSYA